MELKMLKNRYNSCLHSDRDGRNSVTSIEEKSGVKYFTRGSFT